MYEYIQGKFVEGTPIFAVIDVNGVGYKLSIPTSDFGRLPESGKSVLLYASWVVKENSQTLYGFLEKPQRDLFEILITLSGIGPKTALGIIGHLNIPALEEAVCSHDIAAFAKVPGIGKKTAERLLIDLKGKLNFASSLSQKKVSPKMQDAVQALIHLGYSSNAAEKAVKKALDKLSEESDLSAVITQALKLQS